TIADQQTPVTPTDGGLGSKVPGDNPGRGSKLPRPAGAETAGPFAPTGGAIPGGPTRGGIPIPTPSGPARKPAFPGGAAGPRRRRRGPAGLALPPRGSRQGRLIRPGWAPTWRTGFIRRWRGVANGNPKGRRSAAPFRFRGGRGGYQPSQPPPAWNGATAPWKK